MFEKYSKYFTLKKLFKKNKRTIFCDSDLTNTDNNNNLKCKKINFLVIIFIRGSWSTDCLQYLEEIDKQIFERITFILNGKIVAITSQSKQQAEEIQKGFRFEILSDEKMLLAKEFGMNIITKNSIVYKKMENAYKNKFIKDYKDLYLNVNNNENNFYYDENFNTEYHWGSQASSSTASSFYQQDERIKLFKLEEVWNNLFGTENKKHLGFTQPGIVILNPKRKVIYQSKDAYSLQEQQEHIRKIILQKEKIQAFNENFRISLHNSLKQSLDTTEIFQQQQVQYRHRSLNSTTTSSPTITASSTTVTGTATGERFSFNMNDLSIDFEKTFQQKGLSNNNTTTTVVEQTSTIELRKSKRISVNILNSDKDDEDIIDNFPSRPLKIIHRKTISVPVVNTNDNSSDSITSIVSNDSKDISNNNYHIRAKSDTVVDIVLKELKKHNVNIKKKQFILDRNFVEERIPPKHILTIVEYYCGIKICNSDSSKLKKMFPNDKDDSFTSSFFNSSSIGNSSSTSYSTDRSGNVTMKGTVNKIINNLNNDNKGEDNKREQIIYECILQNQQKELNQNNLKEQCNVTRQIYNLHKNNNFLFKNNSSKEILEKEENFTNLTFKEMEDKFNIKINNFNSRINTVFGDKDDLFSKFFNEEENELFNLFFNNPIFGNKRESEMDKNRKLKEIYGGDYYRKYYEFKKEYDDILFNNNTNHE
ncbi:hypothetical protein ABK040_013357 [Willaertia magna]